MKNEMSLEQFERFEKLAKFDVMEIKEKKIEPNQRRLFGFGTVWVLICNKYALNGSIHGEMYS